MIEAEFTYICRIHVSERMFLHIHIQYLQSVCYNIITRQWTNFIMLTWFDALAYVRMKRQRVTVDINKSFRQADMSLRESVVEVLLLHYTIALLQEVNTPSCLLPPPFSSICWQWVADRTTQSTTLGAPLQISWSPMWPFHMMWFSPWVLPHSQGSFSPPLCHGTASCGQRPASTATPTPELTTTSSERLTFFTHLCIVWKA